MGFKVDGEQDVLGVRLGFYSVFKEDKIKWNKRGLYNQIAVDILSIVAKVWILWFGSELSQILRKFCLCTQINYHA